jgi:hypothetical protein
MEVRAVSGGSKVVNVIMTTGAEAFQAAAALHMYLASHTTFTCLHLGMLSHDRLCAVR